MADETPHPKVLKGEDALALARQGKDVWNTWAEDEANAGTKVDFSGYDFTDDPISFAGFIFPGLADFSHCVFAEADFSHAQFSGGEAWFRDAQFNGGDSLFVNAQFSGGRAWFYRAQFSGGSAWFRDSEFSGGPADFHAAVFAQEADFLRAMFQDEALFETTDFKGAVDLNGARFFRVPDFRLTKLAAHFTLHGVKVDYCEDEARTRWLGGLWARAKNDDDADKYRRLKELAIAAKDHDREQKFFASELKAKRFYETHEAALVWSYLYEWFSDFGRSVYRPLVSLYATVVAFGFLYWLTALFSAGGGDKSLDNGLKLSAAVLVPFVAAARTSYGEAQNALFGQDIGLALDLLIIFEGILGLAFVFLIGLALRNRFRI